MAVALTRKFKRKLLLWGVGDLSANLSSLKPVETKDVEISFEGDTVEQEKDGFNWGANKKYRTSDKVKITGKIAFAGSGEAGVAPAYRELFLLSGHKELISKGQSVIYTPITENIEKGTVGFLIDGQFHLGKEAQIELKLSANAGELGYWDFEISMVGGTIPIEPPTNLKKVIEGYKIPKAINFKNTARFSLGSKNYAMKSFEHTTGNEISSIDLVNHQSAIIANRKPTVKITVGAHALAEINLYQKAWDGEEMELIFSHGRLAGEKIEILYGAVALDIPTISDLDGALGYEIECTAMQGSGSPYQITFS